MEERKLTEKWIFCVDLLLKYRSKTRNKIKQHRIIVRI